MFRRGRRLFTVASLLLILVALAHGLGGFAPPQDPEESRLFGAMAGHSIPIGLGMEPSLLDVFKSVWFALSLLLIVWAAQNLCLAQLAAGRVLRAFAVLNVLAQLPFLALYAYYRIPPPLVSHGLIAPLFLASVFTIPRDSEVG